VLSGANISDTVGAAPAQGLVVRLTGQTGQPEAGVNVRFAAVAQPCRSNPASRCYGVTPVFGGISQAEIGATTDAQGRAVASIRFSTLSGPASIAVTVPLYGLADTARYTVQPGAIAQVTIAPDTAIELAANFRVRGAAADRYGNPCTEAVVYGSSSAAATVGADGQVTGAALGGAWVRVRTAAAANWSDSALVVVVPRARIAVSAVHGPIRLSTLTGSPDVALISGNVNAQDWSPAGDQLVYVDDRGNDQYALSLADTLGHSQQLPVPLTSTWPQYSADGQWIYFYTNGANQIYRIHPDGTGLQSLLAGTKPAPAPDGARIAMSTGSGIWVGDPLTKTGAVVPGTGDAEAIRWSPDGQWIAYRARFVGQIVVLHPDGSARGTFAGSSIGGLTWSPDSRWILAGGSTLQLLERSSGASWPLPVTGVYPAWRR
jgi:hypothetical protein